MNYRIMLTIAVVFFISGCSTKVERISVEKVVDLSGRWNDADARMVAQEMIKDCLAGQWLTNFLKDSGRNPTVIVGTVENNSSEHINSGVFIKSLQAELVKSGKVDFVASKLERPEVREERKDQQDGWTDPATIKPIGKEVGADFMLRGSINTVTDDASGKYVILYQVNLELIDMTTNQVRWIDQAELKKLVSKTKYSL